MKSIFLLFFSAMLLAVQLPAQQNTDSLWKVINSLRAKDEATLKKKKQELSNLFGITLYGEIGEALRTTDSLAETCRLLGDSMAYYEALYRNKASVYQNISEYRKTFENLSLYSKALARLGSTNGYAYIDLGNVYYSISLNDVSTTYYRKAGELFAKEKNDQGLATVYDNLALVWREKKNLDSCLYYYEKSRLIRKEKLKDIYLEAYTILREGNSVEKLKNSDAAISYFYRALSVFSQPAFRTYKDFVTMRDAEITCMRFIGLYHLGKSNIDSASWYAAYADSLTAAYQDKRQLAHNKILRAHILIAQKKYDEAIVNIMYADSVMRSRGDVWELLKVLELHSKCLMEKGDWKNAADIYRQRSDLFDSLSRLINDDQMLLMNNALLQYENEARISQGMAEISQQQQKNRLLLFGIIGMVVVILLIVWFLVRLRKKNKIIRHYNSELEAANKTKEKFLSVISHDLRSPFNTLIGLSNQFSDDAQKKQDVRGTARAMQDAARNAYVMLDNLMQWVSLQKEKISVVKQETDTTNFIAQLFALYEKQALTHEVKLEKEISVKKIHTDANVLTVILRNLLSNAIRHIPPGGKVMLRFSAKQDDLLIDVEDNGNGIDEKLLGKIFDQKSGMAVAGKGSGLGLELVKEFTSLLGGTVSAENMKTGGAKFSLLIPGAVLEKEINLASAEIKTEKELSISEKEKLQSIVEELRNFEIFETTDLRRILASADESTEALAWWKQEMLRAVYNGNGPRLEQLLETASIR